ncbi:MAG: hypothetical protein HRU43_00560 [Simkaniaceae bacterium]|nr:hypothetical protein [Simkaniaceae bacterium]
MSENIENLKEENIKKITRAADVLDSFSLKVVESAKALEKIKEDLSDEVTVLRSKSSNIKDDVAQKLEESLPKFAEDVHTLLKNSVTHLTASALEPIQKLEDKQQKALDHLYSLQRNQERKLKLSTLATFLAFCSGSLVTGFGIWYFFPQTSYNTYEFTTDQRRAMEHGTLLQFAMKKMPQKEQEKLWSLMGDSWKEYYEEVFNIKILEK